MISILVIALVVWLIVVFFSVKDGLEHSWIEKLIALTAPVRITPTDAYYSSYYYQVDGISANSDYSFKTIGEKLAAEQTDPYDPEVDSELPSYWPEGDMDADGSLKDLVKKAYAAIRSVESISGLQAQEYLTTVTNLKLKLLRGSLSSQILQGGSSSSMLNQASYLGSFDPTNPKIAQALLSHTPKDLTNLLSMLSYAADDFQDDNAEEVIRADKKTVQTRLKNFFEGVSIKKLKIPSEGWILPRGFLSGEATFRVAAIHKGNKITSVVIPAHSRQVDSLVKKLKAANIIAIPATIKLEQLGAVIEPDGAEPVTLAYHPSLIVEGDLEIPASLVESSIDQAKQAADLRFILEFPLQSSTLKGEVRMGNLEIGEIIFRDLASASPDFQPYWATKDMIKNQVYQTLPVFPEIGEGILVPKSFRGAGVLLGDRGTVSYYAPTASSVQEQQVPVYVAGFYDPGIMPIGGKYILANPELTALVYSAHSQENQGLSNGINIRIPRLEDAGKVKAAIQKHFEEEGLDPYWKVETYQEYEFTRDLIQQLLSEKNMFSLLATIIIVVACSNIISMLIIMVNDKKIEIGILRSMGATSGSIALIFGLCGMVMGVIGSLIGTLAALLTLNNIQDIVDFIGRLQGYDMFNPVFYGERLPAEISYEALAFVVVATSIISMLAGLVPAIKASLIRPSAILRAE
jgi:lipoprotein-releasing system permease protein